MIDGNARQQRATQLEKRQALARNLLRNGRSTPGQFTPIVPLEERGPVPLSFAQERLWFLDRWNPGSSYYNAPMIFRLLGGFHLVPLQKSLETILQRHEVLRTSFLLADGRPLQFVRSDFEVTLPVIDLSTLPHAERQQQTERLTLEEISRPFDLATGPLVRALLLRLGPEEHILLLTLHHIVTDGWSRNVLLREMGTLYDAYVQGCPNPLPSLRIQYADFAVWQRKQLEGEVLERDLGYWRSQLAGAPSVLELPTDRPRPTVQSYRGARLKATLATDLGNRLDALSKRHNVTLFMTLLAAFQILLYRYSGQEDIVVGTPIANRTRPEVEGLIGFFTNTLALRADLSGDPSFGELLGRVREVALEAFTHQDVPFEKLVEELQPERNASHSPIFQVLFMLQHPDRTALTLPGLTIDPITLDRSIAKFDLSLSIAQTPEGLVTSIEYSSDLFDAQRMERLLGHYRTLLEGIVADPEQRLSHLPLLTQAEGRQLLIDWNATALARPREQSVHAMFEEQVQRTPDAVAVEFDGRQLTYAALNRRANGVAHSLRRHGVGLEGRVGLCAERSLEMMVGVLGILKAGAAYVPIDPTYPPERVAYMLRDAGVEIVLAYGDVRGPLDAAGVHVLPLDEAQAGDEPVSGDVPATCAAYVLYTSGSTGRPKGVILSHEALVNLLLWQLQEIPGPARTLQFTSIGFDVSFQEIFTTWCSGGTLVLVNEDTRRDLSALRRRVEEAAIERLFVPFAVLRYLVVPLAEGATAPASLRHVITAGEQLQITAEMRSFFGGANSPTLHNHYGPTEAHVVTAHRLQGDTADWSFLPSIGRPIANVQIHILDGRLQPVPIGVPGELYIGGVCLARGYLNRPDLTAEKFVPDPHSNASGSRLYRTGDLARYLEDGSIEYLGRMDHQVKIRGFRIEPGEIESVLLAHPQVGEAVVVAREDMPGERRLVAYIATSEGEVSAGELRDRLREQLPGHMVPSAFVFLEALPLSPNGKVDRKALPPPEAGPLVAVGGQASPRTPIEEGLAEIWCEVLRTERVGIHDSFFELGGHSLLATQVISRIRSVFQLEMPLRCLFETSTIAGLAERIATTNGEGNASIPSLVRVLRDGRLPLSFSQQRLWFIDQFDPGNSAYNIPTALRLSGRLDGVALEQSLTEIVYRHEALRTTFASIDGEAVQEIGYAEALPLPLLDLQALEPVAREAEARRLIEEEALRPFDLGQGPLFRASLLRLGDEEHILLLTMHHIVSDGWSLGVLMRELGAFYTAFCKNLPSPLPPLAIQYADYACWQREWLQGDELQRQLGYWKEHLRGAPTLLELPTDRPRPAVQSFRGASQRLELSEALTAKIKALSQQEGVTLFMTLLAAFQTLLCRYSGQDDIVVGTPIANRTRSEAEGLIGFFMNVLALRGDLSGDPSFTELLARVRDIALGAYAHQDLPFEKLVEELSPERRLSHSPIFQVMFVLQNAPRADQELDGLRIESISRTGVASKFDLQVTVLERERRLLLSVAYNTDLFDAERIERLLSHFRTLLEGIVADPQQRLSRLPLLTPSERHLVLEQWNDTAVAYPRERCIHELFEEQVARTPEAVAVVFENQRLTYRELNARANQLARSLVAEGVGPETLVGVCLERSLEMLVCLLGILKAGGAYVPLDPAYPAERLTFMLEDTGQPLLLIQEPLRQRLMLEGVQTPCPDIATAPEADGDHNLPNTASGQNLAYVIYTSGSTGQPKGVALTHASAAALLHWAATRYSPAELAGVLASTSVCFDLSVFELFVPLVCGGTVLMADNALGLPSLLKRDQVSLINTVPSVMTELLRLGDLPASVRTVNLAGEPLSVALAQRLYEAGIARVYDLYGPSEDTTYSTCALRTAQGPATIGRPISNTRVYLLDRHLQPVPLGVPGELYIGGAGLARGYLNRPELTAEKFVPDPFSPEAGARMYRTGDQARYLQDGSIEFVGRVDHQVKVRGFRIELGEIESVLVRHPQVDEAVVMAREDVAGDKRLVGYVVASAQAPTAAELRAHLKGKLPEYMVPSAFVFLERLPMTANGKVDRKALPEPDATRRDVENAYESPQTPTEQILAGIWATVLRLDQVGIHDNFFDLGGDSILSIQIIARANKAGLRLTPRQVFEHQTIAGLASAAGSGTVTAGEQGIVTGPVPLTPIQRWFFERELPDPHHFNQARLLRLRKHIPHEAVARVLEALVAHHDALRLRFVRSEMGWKQTNAAEEEGEVFSYVDLSALPDVERSAVLTNACAALQASLNLEMGPLLRAAYFDLGPETPARLLLTIHHLAVDGVSWRILLEDLQSGLEQWDREKVLNLPSKTNSFGQWSQRLQEYARSSALRQEMDFWRREGRAQVRRLRVDHPEGVNIRGAQRTVRASLSVDETRSLLQEVPAAYHTQINDVLVSALIEALAQWTGERAFLVDLEGHGREALFEDMDVSRTVGWFTSLYPVLLELPLGAGAGEALKSIKEQLRSIPNRGVGYGFLRYLSDDPEASQRLAELPCAEISFNYLGQFDQVLGETGLFATAAESPGPSQSPRGDRSHLLDVLSQITDDRLQVAWLYSEQVYRCSTIEGLAEGYLEALRALIGHCRSAGAKGYTPSDFPEAGISQKALDRLLAGIRKK